MNKKILISLSVIAIVAAIGIGGTIAFFSDTETSTGNTFTAGAIDLTIDNTCYYNEMACTDGYWGGVEVVGNECACTWDLDDLDGKVFFNFADLKPGDHGEDTISLHVHDNDAYCWVKIDGIEDKDNTCTEPEIEDEPTCESSPTGSESNSGELDENMELMVWADVCDDLDYINLFTQIIEPAVEGDNVYQPGCDILLIPEGIGGPYPLSTYISGGSTGWVSLYDGNPLIGSETYYIAKSWCFGEFDAVPLEEPNAGDIICDGSDVDNTSQTDSLSGNITFYCEQARNNSNPTPPAL